MTGVYVGMYSNFSFHFENKVYIIGVKTDKTKIYENIRCRCRSGSVWHKHTFCDFHLTTNTKNTLVFMPRSPQIKNSLFLSKYRKCQNCQSFEKNVWNQWEGKWELEWIMLDWKISKEYIYPAYMIKLNFVLSNLLFEKENNIFQILNYWAQNEASLGLRQFQYWCISRDTESRYHQRNVVTESTQREGEGMKVKGRERNGTEQLKLPFYFSSLWNWNFTVGWNFRE